MKEIFAVMKPRTNSEQGMISKVTEPMDSLFDITDTVGG